MGSITEPVHNLFETLRAGEYFHTYPMTSDTTHLLVADTIYALPVAIQRPITIDRIAIRVTSAAAGKIARLGVYKDDGSGYPGSLVKDYGTVSVASAALVEASGDQSLGAALHWFMVVSDGAPTIRASFLLSSPLGILETNFIPSAINKGWTKASVGSGALAATFPSSASMITGALPLVLPRLKSLD